ncbi:unnamed protein product [Rhodiola kirilowii]
MRRTSKYKRMQSVATIIAEDRHERRDEAAPEWVVNINAILELGVVYNSKTWTIYRVPTNLLKIHSNAFVPKIISIGPFHYRDPRLRVMDEHKERYLFRLLVGKLSKSLTKDYQEEDLLGREIIEELGEQDNAVEGVKKVPLEVLEAAMKKLMPKTRETYSEVLTMSNEKFVEMMVLDGCFVVELLRLYHKSLKVKIDDAIFTTRWMLRTLQRDLLMLENQLPFFVLEELYELTKLDEQEPPLINLVLEFLNPLLPRKKYKTKFKNVVPEHILDVLLLSFISPMQKKVTNSSWSYMTENNRSSYVNRAQERQLIHCVTELKEVGVLFKRGEETNLLDITFSNGTLQIPPLYINDNTVPVFLNFLAYEQCDQEAEPYFTNFFTFLDGLISSSKDVEILHQYEIINHALGSKKNVANLINQVCRELVFDVDHCYLSKQMVEVNQYWTDYYATKWHVWRTNLIHDYFSSPWTALSLGAAILLLILTALQTVYSAITFYHH